MNCGLSHPAQVFIVIPDGEEIATPYVHPFSQELPAGMQPEAPAVPWYWPSAHVSHSFWPTFGWNFPAGHFPHTLSLRNLPALQLVQVASVALVPRVTALLRRFFLPVAGPLRG